MKTTTTTTTTTWGGTKGRFLRLLSRGPEGGYESVRADSEAFLLGVLSCYRMDICEQNYKAIVIAQSECVIRYIHVVMRLRWICWLVGCKVMVQLLVEQS